MAPKVDMANINNKIDQLSNKFDEKFSELNEGISHIKDTIIKRLIEDNKHLQTNINWMATQFINMRENNIEISGIPNLIEDNELENKSVEVLKLNHADKN